MVEGNRIVAGWSEPRVLQPLRVVTPMHGLTMIKSLGRTTRHAGCVYCLCEHNQSSVQRACALCEDRDLAPRQSAVKTLVHLRWQTRVTDRCSPVTPLACSHPMALTAPGRIPSGDQRLGFAYLGCHAGDVDPWYVSSWCSQRTGSDVGTIHYRRPKKNGWVSAPSQWRCSLLSCTFESAHIGQVSYK